MPHKGFFTQGAMVLTERALAAGAVERALEPFKVVKHAPAEGEKNWISGYPSWVVAFRPEANGYVSVDVVDEPWPDGMGGPGQPGGQMLLGAWSMGFMGPLTWPGSLGRATQFASALGRGATAAAAGRHGAFVRVRSSYVMGAGDDAKILPEDYQPRPELEFVTSVARALARAPGALAYFNPCGETLLSPDELDEDLEACRKADLAPLPVWAASRLMRVDDAPPWVVADVYGMGQLDAQDQEACFRRDRHDVGEVMTFLRNTSHYVLEQGPVIHDGHTTDGPGGVWRAMAADEGLLPGLRPTLRWFPEDGSEAPAELRRGRAATPARGGLVSRIGSLFRRRR